MNAKRLALFAKAASEDKKGIDPLILDLRGLTDVADYFVLVHGNSDRHVRTIADAVLDSLAVKKIKPLHVEGKNEASWILLDYGVVMIHVFHYAIRQFYSLERLWGDAKVIADHKKYERKAKRTRRLRAA